MPENKWDQINAIVDEAAEHYPFNIMEPEFIKVLMNDIQTYKIRVYLISA